MNLTNAQIDLWFANEGDFDFDELVSHCLGWLTDKEMIRYERFYFDRHRKELLLGKALVRTVLSKYCDKDPAEWLFEENEYGKPALASEHDEDIHFNLSHSGDRLVLAVSRHEYLGVDIECCAKSRRVEKIADRYFTESELGPLLGLEGSAQLDRFYDLWTLKEAYIKARGMGLALSLQQFGFLLEENGLMSLQLDSMMDDEIKGWQYWQLDTGSDYKLALATKTDEIISSITSYQLTSLNKFETVPASITRRFANS